MAAVPSRGPLKLTSHAPKVAVLLLNAQFVEIDESLCLSMTEGSPAAIRAAHTHIDAQPKAAKQSDCLLPAIPAES